VAPLNEPGGQLEQLVPPSCGETWPEAQAVHDAARSEGATAPRGQSRQALTKACGANVPGLESHPTPRTKSRRLRKSEAWMDHPT
jgi:hypothetical protein